MRERIVSVVRIAISVAIISICAWITIPIGPVPMTLQTLGVLLTLLLLGGRDGCVSVGVYLILGLLGVPVFASFTGGVGVLMTATGGYLLGFAFGSCSYLLITRIFPSTRPLVCCIIFFIICYVTGTSYAAMVMGVDFGVSFMHYALPFIGGDVIKCILALIVASRVKKHIGGKHE